MKNAEKTAPLRIAMIGHKTIPGRDSGVEIVVENLSRRLVKQGICVDALNRRRETGTQQKTWEGIRLISIPTVDKKNLDAPVYAFFATIRVCFGKYDLIHYHAEGSCIMLWLCGLFRKKTVVTIHGLDWQRSKWGGLATKVLLFGERCAAKYADEIIVLSRNIQSYFMERYCRNTTYIPNGVEKPQPCSSAPIAKRYGLTKDGYILYLGRIVPEKGLDYLVEAYKGIDTDKRLLIAGGSSHTDDYEKEIQEKAKDDDRILFAGHVEGEDLHYLFSNAYVYVLPSDMEGMPISLLEAMSYGNCCLTSDIEECTEIIGDKAVAFKKGDADDLRDKLKSLIEDSKTVEKYKAAAAGYILEKYNWDDVTEKTIALYRKQVKI